MFQRKRLLIGVSGSLFILPFFIEDIRNLISIGLLYFLGMYFILFNFPVISIFISSKSHYIEDLDNNKYRKYCIALQNLFLSILFGIMTDIFYMEKLHTRSLIEMCGILGGNIALFSSIQQVISKLLLISLSYCEKRERKSSEEIEDEN